ncbi:hypothetical protein [Mucilaginibacter ginkgonis]|uniref:Uncharacterized protein n=1 Tax=Mucilaginibacter ginkgonis TaxID=2682091 RepID=A0A6I4I1W7_9SPHI|nr:hypothetical protein [Mucilaginibacter ginkgonis]QQL50831.1 hypothetical protein GO620_005060 [Mucilaginibacter ginkgonis]
MKKSLFIWLAVLMPLLSVAQVTRRIKPVVTTYQDSLIYLGKKMVNDTVDVERKNANYTFIRTLVKTLNRPGSYNLRFDSVKSITTLYSPDNKFRIFSWHVMNEDGSYRFYGAVQMNTAGKLQLFPLADYTPFIKAPRDTVTSNTQWYGAQYYTIVPVGQAKPYYVLLGWKGNNVKTTKKVIDVLSFKDGKPVFGAPVFNGKGKPADRVIFEYSRQVSMMLKYLPEKATIVFDHLVPPAKGMEGKYDEYGPDLSYDAYQLINGKWAFKDNIDMRNGASAADDMTDPRNEAKRDRLSAGRRN